MNKHEVRRIEILNEVIQLTKKMDNTKEIIIKLETFNSFENYFTEPDWIDDDYKFKYKIFLLESVMTVEDLVLSKRRYNMDNSKVVNISDKEVLEFLDEAEFSTDELEMIKKINEYKSVVKEIILERNFLIDSRIEIERLVLPSYYSYATSVSDKFNLIQDGNIIRVIGLNIIYGIYGLPSCDIEYFEDEDLKCIYERCVDLYISDYLNESENKDEIVKLLMKLHSLINNLIGNREIPGDDIKSNLINFFIRIFRSIYCENSNVEEFIQQNIDKIVLLKRFFSNLDDIPTWIDIYDSKEHSQEIVGFIENWIENIHYILEFDYGYQFEYMDLIDLNKMFEIKDIYPFNLYFKYECNGKTDVVTVNVLNKNSFDNIEIKTLNY